MFTLDTEIEINATPQRVWDILSDFPAYGQWNPLSPAISGELRTGATISVTIQPAQGKPMVSKCRLTACEPLKKLCWLGSAPIPGLVSGEHSLEIEALPNGKVRFRNSEVMKGLLTPFIKGIYDKNFPAQFIAMNEALKKRAESR